MLRKIVENIKWRLKYNRLLVDYEVAATSTIKKLENEVTILTRNMEYRNKIEELNEELMRYRRKYGRLEGGGKRVKNKDKR